MANLFQNLVDASGLSVQLELADLGADLLGARKQVVNAILANTTKIVF